MAIANVYVFPNGMVMVFDEHGQQMPEYQGTWAEKQALILRDLPAAAGGRLHVVVSSLMQSEE